MIDWCLTPGLWAKRTIAILAGGPSLKPDAAARVRACVRIVINDAYRLAPDAEILYAADFAWWQAHPEALDFPGLKLTAQRVGRLGGGVMYCKPRHLGGGSNSALQAACIAAEAGAARLLLLGVDLDDRHLTHWHGSHGRGLRNPTVKSFALARRAWARFATLPNRPEVINCSPDSALTCFPRMSLWEASCS